MNIRSLIRRKQRLTSLLFVVIGMTLGHTCAAATPPKGDPNDWVCERGDEAQIMKDVQAFCAVKANRQRTPEPSWMPASLLQLEQKNEYDERFGDWLGNHSYRDWVADRDWRFTGPVVGSTANGKIASGAQSYGVHPAVRIYYSPKMVDWLCNDRQGEIPDGAVIVKEMMSITEPTVDLGDNSCLSIPTQQMDDNNIFWAVMVKDQEASHDGWYWVGNEGGGNPPIVNASAAGSVDTIPPKPSVPDPAWYPTNTASKYVVDGQTYDTKPITVYPYNSFGNYCINCHASAASESTYSSLENVVSAGIQYHFYPQRQRLQARAITPNAKHDMPLAAREQLLAAKPSAVRGTERPAPFSTPLNQADPNFVAFYNQISPVNFSAAWDLRLPAETFDHKVSTAHGPGQFLTSDQCMGCHDATVSNSQAPNMVFTNKQGEEVNLSPYATWRTSPMGLAGRDPIFFSQLQSETNNLPELTTCIENTCLHCHGVMGQRQLAIDTQNQGDECRDIFPVPPPKEVPFGQPFALSNVTQYQNTDAAPHAGDYGGLARDGISCAVCHHISDEGLGTEAGFTGNFITGPGDEVYGPFGDDTIVPKPMEHALGVTPKFAAQIKSSELCSSCHNILLPVFTNDGKPLPGSYEQTTGLEWSNSQFAWSKEHAQSCQDCHMKTHFEGEPLNSYIANIEDSNSFPPTTNRLPDEDIRLTKQKGFARHTLLGLNVFLNEMFQQFPVLLGLRQIDYMNGAPKPALTHTRDQFIEIAENETATISVQAPKVDGNTITTDVTVHNKAGHYLPSGVGFRRVILEYRLVDASGNTLWCSGCTNDLGVVVDGATLSQRMPTPLPSELPIKNPKAYQPHYQLIERQDQAQIYQELITDSAGDFTTSFLRRVTHVKDNRLRPLGYDPEFFKTQFDSKYIQELSITHGEAANDPYYTDPSLTGADQIRYSVNLDAATLQKVAGVEVRLFNQSIPPFYLQQRFRDANRGPAKKNEIQRLWYLTSHLNTNTMVNGQAYIKQWKLGLVCAKSNLNGQSQSCAL